MKKLPFMEDMNKAELDRFETLYQEYKQKVKGRFNSSKMNKDIVSLFMNKKFHVQKHDINLLSYFLMRANEDGCAIKHKGFIVKICPLGLDTISDYYTDESLKYLKNLILSKMFPKIEYRVTIQQAFDTHILFDFTCTKENFKQKFNT